MRRLMEPPQRSLVSLVSGAAAVERLLALAPRAVLTASVQPASAAEAAAAVRLLRL